MEHKGLRPLINPGFFRQSHAASRAAQKTILSPARREAISMGAGAFCTPGSSALAGFLPWDTGLCCPCAAHHSPRRQLPAEHGFLPAIVHGRGKTPFSFAPFSPALRPPGVSRPSRSVAPASFFSAHAASLIFFRRKAGPLRSAPSPALLSAPFLRKHEHLRHESPCLRAGPPKERQSRLLPQTALEQPVFHRVQQRDPVL